MTTPFAGFVQAGLQLGLNTVLFKPKRGIYNAITSSGQQLKDIIAQATIEEQHHDELEITEHPVQQGAAITDHAFKRPAEVTLHLGWSNSPSAPSGLLNPLLGAAAAASPAVLTGANIYGIYQGVVGLQSAINGENNDQIAEVYNALLELQSTRALFDIFTGKRNYVNMLVKSISTETDNRTENSLMVKLVCKQLILVNTQTVSLPAEKQKDPTTTASPVNNGTLSAPARNLTPAAAQ